MVASKVEAELLILLSDIDGLYNKNPKKNEDAQLISTVEKITPEIERYGGKPHKHQRRGRYENENRGSQNNLYGRLPYGDRQQRHR